MNLVVVYLASPRAAGWLEWYRLDCLCASVALLRRHVKPALPVIVFHEDYTPADLDRLRTAAQVNLKTERVDFRGHETGFVDTRPGERVGTYGYRMMCRFWSGEVQLHSLLDGYSHYLRLDDDSYIIAPVPNETLGRLTGNDYTYSSTFSDPHESLWRFARDFMAREGLGPPAAYTEAVPYTNFHAASLSLWRHPVMLRFADRIESERGCLRYGWDDAMVGAIVAYSIAPALGMTVNLEAGFPYRHNQQCCHAGPHTPHCDDGSGREFRWGPPAVD